MRTYSTYDFIARDIRHSPPTTSAERMHFQKMIDSAYRRGEITGNGAEELLSLLGGPSRRTATKRKSAGRAKPKRHTVKRRMLGRVRAKKALGSRKRRKWNPRSLQSSAGKKVMLRFLPYLETPDGKPAAKTIGYTPASVRRGYGYGRWEEFFNSTDDARERMRFLAKSKAIEDAEIREDVPGHGFTGSRLVDEWREGEDA